MLMLFIAVMAVSTGGILVKSAQRDVPSEVIALYRLGLAAIGYVLISAARHELATLKAEKGAWLLPLSGVFLAFHFITWFRSLEYTNILSSVVLVNTAPFWTAIFSMLFLRDRISRRFWIGLLIAFTGILVINLASAGAESVAGDRPQSMLGNLYALAGAMCMSGYALIGKVLRQTLPITAYAAGTYGSAALVVLAVVLLQGIPIGGYPASAVGLMVLLALIPQMIGHTAFNWSLKHLPAYMSSLAMLGEPAGASALAILFLREYPTLAELAGGLLILAGIITASSFSKVTIQTEPD